MCDFQLTCVSKAIPINFTGVESDTHLSAVKHIVWVLND